jgi:hypothetical protein
MDRKLLDDLNGLVEPEARGDPMSPLRLALAAPLASGVLEVADELLFLGVD